MSKKRSEKCKDKTKKTNCAAEEASITADDYHCSGSLHVDLPHLCLLLGTNETPVIITTRPQASQSPTADRDSVVSEHDASVEKNPLCSTACVIVVLENDDPVKVKSIRTCGWKVDVLVARVLRKLLPSLSNLQTVHLWQARLSDQMVISLNKTFLLCSNLRTVVLEGNPLPEHSYHLLISKNSTLTHLSLRNNRIGVKGARLIGLALSTARSANRNLVCLNLAFNSIGDAGAAHIAQGLRLNRALICLSLSNNKIEDTGAAHLAKVLGQFALTHEEIVVRRQLLLDREQSLCGHLSSESIHMENTLAAPSSSSLNTHKAISTCSLKKKELHKKDEKPAVTKKDDHKSHKKSPGHKMHHVKPSKSIAKGKGSVCDLEDKSTEAVNEVEPLENPLLEASVQHRDGQVLLCGNAALSSLNLSGNRISEVSLPLFLTSLQMQTEGGGLLRLNLQRNSFCPDCEDHVKIRELMTLRDPLTKTTAAAEQCGHGD